MLEEALRRSPAHELLFTLGRRATLGDWYRAEKRGIRPGSVPGVKTSSSSSELSSAAVAEEVLKWEGEALPDGAELSILEGRLREAMTELGGEVRPSLLSPST